MIKSFEQFINESVDSKKQELAEMFLNAIEEYGYEEGRGYKYIWFEYNPYSRTSMRIDADDFVYILLDRISRKYIDHIVGFRKNEKGNYECILDDEGQKKWDKERDDYHRGATEYYNSKRPGEYTGD